MPPFSPDLSAPFATHKISRAAFRGFYAVSTPIARLEDSGDGIECIPLQPVIRFVDANFAEAATLTSGFADNHLMLPSAIAPTVAMPQPNSAK